MPDATTTYRGRFAPSPTGPLHFGSLIAALASYLDARHHRGAWLVRVEDLDPPREEPEATQKILHSLQHHGLFWDETPVYQSQRYAAYQSALQQLNTEGQLFKCDCTRALLGPNGACNGRCKPRQADIVEPVALRVSVPAQCVIEFDDRLQGHQHAGLGEQLPDFVVRRKDALFAYQLAVVVDDAAQHITHIVRGSDLLDSTPRQIFLQQALDYPTPQYCHIPVITGADGQKLSKQNHAPALDDSRPCDNLRDALAFLQQPSPPPALNNVQKILAFAMQHWSLRQVPAKTGIAASPSPHH
tara:strand:+ start:28926 stop:29825 length:900 start_codon:yes stop_codon:yes gene_type:complete